MGGIQERSDLKGLAAGLAAGAAATWLMTAFQNGWSAASSKLSENGDSGDGNGQGDSPQDEAAVESATAKAAGGVSEHVFGHQMTRRELEQASPVVHYAFGTLMGGLYGVLAERSGTARSGGGTGFATALWLCADEVAVPAMGLSGPPTQMPLSSHAYGLASHLVYGAALEACRRGVRRLL